MNEALIIEIVYLIDETLNKMKICIKNNDLNGISYYLGILKRLVYEIKHY